jgi:hypothetical protein
MVKTPTINGDMVFFRRFEFSTTWFFSTLVFVCGLGAYVNLLTPQSTFSVIGLLTIIAGGIFCFSMFLTHSVKRSAVFATGILIFLILRFLGLREWYFPLLLSITVLSTDAYLVRLDKTGHV